MNCGLKWLPVMQHLWWQTKKYKEIIYEQKTPYDYNKGWMGILA